MKENDHAKSWFQPLAQIFTYCVRNDARYGYIITDKELVAVRVGPTKENDPDLKRSVGTPRSIENIKSKPKRTRSKKEMVEQVAPYIRALKKGCIEYKVIPWSHHATTQHEESTVMTVNLALWWLHMMAAKDGEIQDEYAPLRDNEWATDDEFGTQSSSFAVSEDLPDKLPLTERSFNSGLDDLHLESEGTGKKRSRKDNDDGGDSVEQASPQKRRTRGHK